MESGLFYREYINLEQNLCTNLMFFKIKNKSNKFVSYFFSYKIDWNQVSRLKNDVCDIQL